MSEVTAPVQRVIDLLRQMGLNPKGPIANRHGSPQWESRCPAHDDRMPSLGVSVGREGDCVLNCQAGCSKEDILKALGLSMADLFLKRNNPRPNLPPRKPAPAKSSNTPPASPPAKSAAKPRKIHPTLERAIGAAKWSTAQRLEVPEDQVTFAGQWDYHNAAGRVAAVVVRFDLPKSARDEKPPKQFVPLHPNGDGWSIGDPPRWPLYHLPEVMAAVTAKRRIFFTEGEKAADAVRSLGLVATTTAHGAKSPRGTDFTPLAGVDEVICLPDNDESGREFVKAVTGLILSAAPVARVRSAELPGLPEKGDFVEWVNNVRARAPQPCNAEIIAELDEIVSQCLPPITLDHLAPVEVATAFLTHRYTTRDGAPKLLRTMQQFLGWTGSQYDQVDEEKIKAGIYSFLNGCIRKSGKPMKPNRSIVSNVMEAIVADRHTEMADASPRWLTSSPDHPPAHEMLACKSKLLHLPTRRVLPATPAFFTTCSAPFDYDAGATAPTHWLKFLDEVFKGEADQISMLQEWFGYCLTPDTRQQKILLIIGPPRSGKGTIARVLSRLLGSSNVSWPSLSMLAHQFGLEKFIGKTLAIVPDAKFEGLKDEALVVERLKSISGEDAVDIQRKFLKDLSVQLPLRFMILSNDFPKLKDASAAIAKRFLTLQTRGDFYEKEDIDLTPDLVAELPGILNWSLDGLDRLRQRRRFSECASSKARQRDIEDTSSPVGAYVRECCTLASNMSVALDVLYDDWKRWAEEEGITKQLAKNHFRRDLFSRHQHLVLQRPRTSGRQIKYVSGITLGQSYPPPDSPPDSTALTAQTHRTHSAQNGYQGEHGEYGEHDGQNGHRTQKPLFSEAKTASECGEFGEYGHLPNTLKNQKISQEKPDEGQKIANMEGKGKRSYSPHSAAPHPADIDRQDDLTEEAF
jgi:putative DNA primase/helicase